MDEIEYLELKLLAQRDVSPIDQDVLVSEFERRKQPVGEIRVHPRIGDEHCQSTVLRVFLQQTCHIDVLRNGP